MNSCRSGAPLIYKIFSMAHANANTSSDFVTQQSPFKHPLREENVCVLLVCLFLSHFFFFFALKHIKELLFQLKVSVICSVTSSWFLCAEGSKVINLFYYIINVFALSFLG